MAAAADIGEIPDVVDAARRESCRDDLLRFLVTYFPHTTGLTPLSPDHERMVARMQNCAVGGGRYVQAVFRGAAKTTIAENAAIWAVLYAHRRFVAVFGADAPAASRMIDSIKRELQDNDLLYEDFPEVCHAVRALEGKVQRCKSQTHGGTLTSIEWTAERIVLPSIAGSAAGGAVVSCHGLTAGSRGLKYKRPDGKQQRPDWVILDDPQTDESAESPLQVAKRLSLLKKNILRLGGHRETLACVVNATVIARGDMIERLLDAKLSPGWQGERIPFVKSWSVRHDDLWLGTYKALRTTFDRNNPDDQKRAWNEATEFYRQNQAAMDEGCVVAWESCFNPEDEISAVQHAYNALIDDGQEVFASEFQQEPLESETEGAKLSVEDILAKANNLPAGTMPKDHHVATAFIDVQGSALYWLAASWGAGFGGHVLGYGVFPSQPRHSLALADVTRTLEMAYPGTGPEGAIYAGVQQLIEQIAKHEWAREDGAVFRTDRILVDSRYQPTIVHEAVRRSAFKNAVRVSKGRYYGAKTVPMELYKARQGERLGHHWIEKPIPAVMTQTFVEIDANYWKSTVRDRIQTPFGDAGCLSIYGEPRQHEDLAAQCLAEYFIVVESDGRRVEEWEQIPHRDNHLWDCLVGAAVAASQLGVHVTGSSPRPSKKPLRIVRYSEIQRQRRANRGAGSR